MKQGTQVTLTVGHHHYPIATLQGEERLSQPYEFTLTLTQPLSIDIRELLSRDAIVTIGERSIFGFLYDVNQEQNRGVSTVTITVKFCSRLSKWRDQHHAMGFPDQNTVEFLLHYGQRHGYDAHDFETQHIKSCLAFPYRLQVPDESDLAFFQRQLARSGIYFWPKVDSTHEAWIFSDGWMPDNIHVIEKCVLTIEEQLQSPNLIWTDQIEVKTGLQNMTATAGDHPSETITHHGFGAPNQQMLEKAVQFQWQAINTRRVIQTTQIKEPMLGLLDILDVSSAPYAKFNRGRVISITHHADESDYWQSITMIPHDVPYRDEIPDHPTVPSAWLGTIDHGTNGFYYSRLSFDLSDYPFTRSIPPIRCLAPIGWHAPILPGTRVCLSAIDGNPDQLIISAVLPEPEQGNPVTSQNSNDYCWQSPGGLQMLMRDDDGIFLKAKQLIECNEAKSQFNIEAVSGDLQETASTIHWQSDSNMSIDSDGDYHLNVDQAEWSTQSSNLHWQSNREFAIESDILEADINGNWQMECEETLDWQEENDLLVSAEKLQISSDSEWVIAQAKQVTFTSQHQLTLVSGETRCRLSANGLLELQSESLGLHAKNKIKMTGNIAYLKPQSRPVRDEPVIELLKKLWHQPFKMKSSTTIQHLQWRENWKEWDALHMASAVIVGHPKGSPVIFSVYACDVPIHQTVSGIEPARLDDASHRILISQEKLTLPAANQQHEYQFIWRHPKTTFERWSGHVVFRFHVQVGDESSEFLSTPLQLLGDLKIHCQERVRDNAQLNINIDHQLIEPGIGTPPILDRSIAIENQDCHLTKIPFYTRLTARLHEPPRTRDIFTATDRSPNTSVTLWLTPKDDSNLILGVLMPPVIINTQNPTLTDEELQYFIENGNNALIFIHGYNVSYERAQEWLRCMEQNLNKAAGFSDDYHQYTRIILFTWEGCPTISADYYESMKQSFRDSEKLADLIWDIKHRAPQLKINLMGHSLGNSLILHALDWITKQCSSLVDNVFLWQAAVPRNVLNPHGITKKYSSLSSGEQENLYQAQARNPWVLPYALAGSKQWSILFSKNDSLLGPLLGEKFFSLEQSEINQYKPFDELLMSLIFKYLDLNSLYSTAIQIGLSASQLLEVKELDRAYQMWRLQHPDWTHDAHGQELQPTLHEQSSRSLTHFANASFILNLDSKLYLAMVKIYTALAKLGLVNSEKIRENMPIILELGAANALHPAITFLLLLGELLQVDLQSFKKHFTSARQHQSFIQLSDWYSRAWTFVRLVTETNIPEFAMGYSGVEDADRRRVKEYDLTDVIYAHSDMKNPRPSIQERAYQNIVMKTLKQTTGFGSYFP